ncbi:MAG: YcjX family protein, partial [Pseudomonadota bacterium]
MASLTSIGDESLIAFDTVTDRASGLFNPTIRLGVTGLSRAGKSVFITALVHNLVHGGRLPLFDAAHSNRLARAYLEPQPDDGVPRFAYEDHVKALLEERIWPQSTRAVSQLRLTIEYESASGWNRMFSGGKLHLDIVDYPGEWLLDLPLLGKNFATFSAESIERAHSEQRDDIAATFLGMAKDIDPDAPADESTMRALSEAFKSYLA